MENVRLLVDLYGFCSAEECCSERIMCISSALQYFLNSTGGNTMKQNKECIMIFCYILHLPSLYADINGFNIPGIQLHTELCAE